MVLFYFKAKKTKHRFPRKLKTGKKWNVEIVVFDVEKLVFFYSLIRSILQLPWASMSQRCSLVCLEVSRKHALVT